jgi:poly-gamma-glutamate synthesis protein (capsule biosynthesis protein)
VLAGDVMTGRGIDQVMVEPVSPELHEPWVDDAREYVRLAERAHGPIARPVGPEYVWGEALAEKARFGPDLFVVNLETAVTAAGAPWPGKGIHYRMNPRHVDCLVHAGVDACVLANNHVLDWGHDGLRDTLAALAGAGIATAGAGPDAQRALAPAVLPLPAGARLLLFAWATPTSGVPADWRAGAGRPGVALLDALGEGDAQAVAQGVQRHRRPGDRVVVSLHWGGNWVERVPAAHRHFAHRLIDLGAADVVHGHSSHHPLPIEVHAGRPILYGCGDLVNDYEGITPRGHLRSDMGCLYAVTFGLADGALRMLEVVPLQLRRFRLEHPEPQARRWLQRLLGAGCQEFGTRLEEAEGGRWRLAWT